MTHREGQWYGGTIHGKPKVTAPEKVSTKQQAYREGGNPWSNLKPSEAVAMRAELERIREDGHNIYDYDQRVANQGDTELTGNAAGQEYTYAVVAAAIGPTAAAGYVNRKVAASVSRTKVVATTATIDKSRAEQNRNRQVAQHVAKLVATPAGRWDNYLKWNVPKALRPLVISAVQDQLATA
ncbi:hypothetical protein SEA_WILLIAMBOONE_192 [Gordonia phage WilliamBoone]|nr:hypothetical protein SEA_WILLIAMBOONE_192 [Gordonia phage WilliamBoone]